MAVSELPISSSSQQLVNSQYLAVPGKTAVYEAYFGTNPTQPFVRPENPTVSNADVNGDGVRRHSRCS